MICSYHFGAKAVQLFITRIGTHAEYPIVQQQRTIPYSGILKVATKPYALKRSSGMERLAAGVNYLIGNETDEHSFVFGEPETEYKKPNPSSAKPIAVKKSKH
jgi:hypothetical protein